MLKGVIANAITNTITKIKIEQLRQIIMRFIWSQAEVNVENVIFQE